MKKVLSSIYSFLKGMTEGLETLAGKIFNSAIIVLIIASLTIFVLETMPWFSESYGQFALEFETIAVFVFSVEYILRWITTDNKLRYPFSFMAIIDLIAVLPFYLSLVYGADVDATYLRVLRLFRIFRIFKLARYSEAIDKLIMVFKENASSLGVFMFLIVIILLFSAATMYTIEGKAKCVPEIATTAKSKKVAIRKCDDQDLQFATMADSLWWSIVTLTTVGYGDKYPATALGKFVAGILMIFGIGIIALPTGILGASLTRYLLDEQQKTVCPGCGNDRHNRDARFCFRCGEKLIKVSLDEPD